MGDRHQMRGRQITISCSKTKLYKMIFVEVRLCKRTQYIMKTKRKKSFIFSLTCLLIYMFRVDPIFVESVMFFVRFYFSLVFKLNKETRSGEKPRQLWFRSGINGRFNNQVDERTWIGDADNRNVWEVFGRSSEWPVED